MTKSRWMFFGVILLAGLLLSCAANKDWATRIEWPDFEFAKLPTAEDFPRDGAVILLDEGNMQTFLDGDDTYSIFTRHLIVKILRTSGKRFANVVIPYVPGSKVDRIEARTISPRGEIAVLKPENIYDVSLYPNFIFYSDQRAKIFTFPAVDLGAVLEYRYELTIHQETVWHAWQFQSNVPTLISRFVLTGPSTWELKYKTYGVDLEPFVTETPSGLKKTYSWELRNLPPLKREYGMPPVREVAVQIALAPLWVKTWDDVSKWYHDLSEPKLKPGKRLKKFAHQLTDSLHSDQGKLRAIYEWVRDHVRFIAVSIGIGGYQPHAAGEVFVNQYGDCKDMATLMCAMAREVGIPAYEVIISTWQNGLPDTTLPSPFHFNHVISYFPTIGDSGLFLDATDKGTPFGELPWYDQGLPVLIVEDDGKGKIITTPKRPAEWNWSKVEWAINLNADGSARVYGTTTLHGSPASDVREFLLFTEVQQQRRWLEGILADQCQGAVLEAFSFNGVQPIADTLKISYQFYSPIFASRQSNRIMMKPFLINALQLPDYFRSPERTQPVRLNFGFQSELILTYTLPRGWGLESRYGSDSITSQFGEARYFWNQEGNQLVVRSFYKILGKEISKEQYPRFREFLENVRKKDLTDFMLILLQ